MWDLFASAFLVGLPAVSFGCFVAALFYRRACPSWLLVLALIPAAVAALANVWWMLQGPAALGIPPLALLVAAVAMLAWTLASRRVSGAPVSRRFTVIALALPLPVMAVFVAASAYLILVAGPALEAMG